ncbi:hypothetical protein RI065_08425 [Mycoplasmatota bacterium zrk1]
MNYCEEQELIVNNPMRKFMKLNKDVVETVTLSPKIYSLLLKVC